MSPSPCEALREIQLGNQPIENFAQPRVFESGLYEKYGVTISDIRQHLRDCKSCVSSRPTAQNRLREYDEEQAEALGLKLMLLDTIVKKRLEKEELFAKSLAEGMATEHTKDSPGEDLYYGIVEDYSRSFFEESKPRVYLWAIKIHVVVGELAFQWLETMVPPNFSRRRFSSGSKTTNIRLQDGDLNSHLKAASDMPGLPCTASPVLAPFLVRALLLHRAFRGLLPELEQLKTLFTEYGQPINKDEQTFGIDWQMVWEHYSSLADSIAGKFFPIVGSPQLNSPQPTALTSESINDSTPNIKQMVDDLLQGQTATMVHLMEMGKDLSHIRDKLTAFPSGTESSGLKEVPLPELISAGESERLEFKASLRWDHKFQRVNKGLQEVVAKAVAGMLNTHGGTVLIGVNDDGTVCGIEWDWANLGRKNQDGFGQTLSQTLSDFLGPEFAVLYSPAFESSDGKTVCRVSVKRSPEPVFFKGPEGKEFYIRAGNTTRKLDSQAATNYILRNWHAKK